MIISNEEKISSEKKLLDFLEKEKIFSNKQISFFEKEAKKLNISPINFILENNEIDEEKIIDLLSEHLGFTKINLATVSITQEAIHLFTRAFALEHGFFP